MGDQSNGTISCLQTYSDEAWDECFYCLTFAVDKKTMAPLLIIGGELGVIKIINCHTQKVKRALLGHGYRINHLMNHPFDNNIIISCSDDQSLRIWNIKSGHCLAIICGHDGHRAAVLGCDVHSNGKYLVSCGKDHAIKIWELKNMKAWIEASYNVKKENHENVCKRKKSKDLSVQMIQFPVYCRRKIHTYYVDHIEWFGDLIMSKSTESIIKIWLPPLNDFEKSIQTMGGLRYENGNCLGLRFGMDVIDNLVVVGSVNGKVYAFELDKYFSSEKAKNEAEEDEIEWHTLLKPKFVSKYKPIVLDLEECDVRIRNVQMNRLGDLIAVTDNGTFHNYKKVVI